ncbi:MAG: glycine cleavage system aminomethyltransferase GcvT [Rhodothermales bacterium]
MSDIQTTPLHAEHIALGAKMMAFGGFDMPVQYSGIIDEHMAVRNAAGLFDVSHMGEVLVTGSAARDFVQNLVTNDVDKLYDGRAMYTAMCKPDGGIVDDLLVYRRGEDSYMLVINASNIDKDVAWMRANNPMNAAIDDVSAEMGLLALQGPNAFAIAQQLTDLDLSGIKYYHFIEAQHGEFAGCSSAVLSHTGYTGEAGLELYVPAAEVATLWTKLLEVGAAYGLKPAGLGARDTLRLEAGYSLYGHELTEETNTIEASLGWVTKLETAFIGRDALAAVRAEGAKRRIVGFVLDGKGIARQGYPILNAAGDVIGKVTSGSHSPILECGIGLGYVENTPEYTTPGTAIGLQVRKRVIPATVQKPPFHK